jgi:hypothetical protein
LSKRWFMAVARCHRSLAKVAVRVNPRRSCALNRCVPEIIQAASPQSCARMLALMPARMRSVRILFVVGTIAAAGRSGVEEMYGVPYLDVGCDVCFHVA